MKHFICLKERYIVYTDSENISAEGNLKKLPAEGKQGLEQAARDLAETCDLKGKRAEAATDRKIGGRLMTLPKAGLRELEEMAANRLTAEEVCRQKPETAVDVIGQAGAKSLLVMVYYAEKKELDEFRNALRKAGIRSSRLLIYSAYLARLAERGRREKSLILVCFLREELRVFGISQGRCIVQKCPSFKPEAFLDLGAEDVLLEEVRDLAEETKKEMEKADLAPEYLLVEEECLKDPAGAADYLGKELKLPCSLEKRELFRKKVSEGFSEKILADRKLPSFEMKRKKRGFFNAGAGILLANLAAALILFGLLETRLESVKSRTEELKQEVESSEYRERAGWAYLTAREQDQVRWLQSAADRIMDQEAAGNPVEEAWFLAVRQSLEPGMEIGELHYRGAEGILEAVILAEDPASYPVLEERIRSTGKFEQVGCSMWERTASESKAGRALFRMIPEKEGRNGVQ